MGSAFQSALEARPKAKTSEGLRISNVVSCQVSIRHTFELNLHRAGLLGSGAPINI